MAKENYSYKKYQKELAKKKKREEKVQSRLAKKNMQASAPLSAQPPRPIGAPSAPLSAADEDGTVA